MYPLVSRFLLKPRAPRIVFRDAKYTASTTMTVDIPRAAGRLCVVAVFSDAGTPTTLTGFTSVLGIVGCRVQWKLLLGNEAATLSSTVTSSLRCGSYLMLLENFTTVVPPVAAATLASGATQTAPAVSFSRGGGNALCVKHYWSYDTFTAVDITGYPTGFSQREAFFGGNDRQYGVAEPTGLSTLPAASMTLAAAPTIGVAATIGIRGQ